MKIRSERVLKNRMRLATVELAPGEQLIAIRDNAHYKLGYPVEEVVGSHVVQDIVEVMWCSASQAWVS